MPRGTSHVGDWSTWHPRGDWPTTRADQIWQHLIGQPENPRIPKLVVVVVVGAEMPVNVVQRATPKHIFRDNMVYWEFLMAGKFEFTQFDPVVAEKHSGLQFDNSSWEENSIIRFY